MLVVELVLLTAFIGAPVSIGLAWRARSRAARVPLVGLIAGTTNVTMFYLWLILRLCIGATGGVWGLREAFGNAGIFLSLITLIAGALGPSGALVSGAVLGFLMWVPVGIL